MQTEFVKRGKKTALAITADPTKPLYEAQVERLIEVLTANLATMRRENGEAPDGYERVQKPAK